MTSKSLLSHAAEIVRITNPQYPLTKLLATLCEALDETAACTGKIIAAKSSGVASTSEVEELYNLLKEVGVKAREGRLAQLFQEAAFVKQRLMEFFWMDHPEIPIPIPAIVQLIDRFTVDLENYWRNHKPIDLYTTILSGSRLFAELSTFRTAAQVILKSLTPVVVELIEGEKTLSLELPYTPDLVDFGRKLSAMAELYSEFCQLLQVSEAQFPLRIVKVESGSLLATIAGSAAVMELLRRAIVAGVGYYHRNYTREGRIQQIPRELEAAKAILQLADELKARGAENSATIEQINKTTEIVADKLNTLLAGQEGIQIDGTPYPITTEAQERLLRGRTILSLGDRTAASDA